ncbi:MAG: 7,8-didemethyl-8-hydroxy-5-deazariboflavin synthase [Actinobacteria bacterium]|nr:MAG: 7,8-didemethyl-8-hydroxy-5-deazariboflavin synthase [Actinomycetota bacterium]
MPAAPELLDASLGELCVEACRVRAEGHGSLVTYSPKVFIPLTKLCRDVCHYCTFARPPRRGERAYMSEEEVLAVARAGAAAGCHEALFTLGDKPELRYRAAREELRALGCETTLEYLARCARLVLEGTGLLPHVNPGLLSRDDLRALRAVSASQGLMLESVSERLSERGGPHFGSPDKLPDRRLTTIAAAGEERVPFTSGILIGIGETRAERVESLLAICDLGERHGHVQEVIVQNFRAKPGTRMADAPEPSLEELMWTTAAARVVLGAGWNIQTPPNLSYADFPRLLDAGINDWGGVSPVTIDHVNPEAPWPELESLRAATEARGLALAPRLCVYPEYIAEAERWLAPEVAEAVRLRSDADGLAREDHWTAGADMPPPAAILRDIAAGTHDVPGTHDLLPDSIVSGCDARVGNGTAPKVSQPVATALAKSAEEIELDEDDVTALLRARGRDFNAVIRAADALRREVCGDTVTYVVTRNINYTNVCYFRCGFCAFSKGRLAANLRGRPYLVPVEEIVRRTEEARERGAVEVCLQGGIHPAFTGETYLEICRAIKHTVPDIHVHAFSALEVWQGAATLGEPLPDYLARLRDAGLTSLPGTAAEVLDDEVRRVICPDKVTTAQWLEVHDTAHRAGLRSTTTLMFGHVDAPRHWARHLLRLRDQQRRSEGFTELVPLPFVHMEAPIFLKGMARRGPTFRETMLVHAAGRLALHPWITNVQASWVKLGTEGAAAALQAGANDLGGTLMNESISRAAGAEHGQEPPPEQMEAAIRSLGRTPCQRTTLYGRPDPVQVSRSFGAAPLVEHRNPDVSEAGLRAPPRLVRPGLAAAAR